MSRVRVDPQSRAVARIVHPRGRIEHGVLEFPDAEPVDTGRRLVLALLLADLDVSVSTVDRPPMTHQITTLREAGLVASRDAPCGS